MLWRAMRLVIFGPNGSGKGTQGARLRARLGVAHVESGVLLRDEVTRGTPLGVQAAPYMRAGRLVPDDLTVPMIRDRLARLDCAAGFVLDGYPRTPAQAAALLDALGAAGNAVDRVIELALDRATAAARIMGRRVCASDNNHPNNTAIAAIAPATRGGAPLCRVCGATVATRADDQDRAAIDRRHDVYYDTAGGTLAAVTHFRRALGPARVVTVDGTGAIDEVATAIAAALG
jgi:adenylate kinase